MSCDIQTTCSNNDTATGVVQGDIHVADVRVAELMTSGRIACMQ